MSDDATTLDDRLALAGALAHLAAVASSATLETRLALAVVLPLLTDMQDAALPVVDLDALLGPHGDWLFGPHVGVQHIWNSGDAVCATSSPDVDGATVYVRKATWTRDQLPELAGFLMAVYAASDPAKRMCDCGAENESHEAFCAVTA